MQKRCPVCAAPGEDLVFKFECTNRECQNFAGQEQTSEPGEPEEDDSEDHWMEWMAWAD